MFDVLVSHFLPFMEHTRLTIEVVKVLSRIKSLVPTFLHKGLYNSDLFTKIVLCNLKCNLYLHLRNALQKIQFLLTFFDISQPFKCLSIPLPNITMDFLLFKLMSRLLIDHLSSILSAFLLDVLNPFLHDDADCFKLKCVVFLFSFCILFVLPFSVGLENFSDFESVITSVWIDVVLLGHWKFYFVVLNYFSLLTDLTKNQ